MQSKVLLTMCVFHMYIPRGLNYHAYRYIVAIASYVARLLSRAL